MSIKITVKSGSVKVVDTRGNNVYILEEGIDNVAKDSISAFLEGFTYNPTSSKSAFLEGASKQYPYTLEIRVVDSSEEFVVDSSSQYVVVHLDGIAALQQAFLKGGEAGTEVFDSSPAYLEGVGDEATGQQSAYLKGKSTAQSSQSGYLKGGVEVETSTSAYTEGAPTATGSTPAYLEGRDTATDQISAFLAGKSTAQTSLAAFLNGVVRASQSAFMEGTEPVLARGSVSAFLASDGFWPFTDNFTGSDDSPWDELKWVTEKYDAE